MPCFTTRPLHVGDDLRIACWGCDGHDPRRPVAEVMHAPTVMIVLRGRFAWRDRDGRAIADPRTALAVDAGNEHEIHHPDGGDVTLAFSGPAVRDLVVDGPRTRPVSSAAFVRLSALARGPIAPDAAAELTVTALDDLGRCAHAPTPARADHEIVRAIEYAIDHAGGRDVALPALAAAAGVSVAHACRAFRRATGGSIHRRVVEARLRHALALVLDGTTPLAEVALAAGFANQGHLGNAFAARFGTSPGRARRDPDALVGRLRARRA